jgi:hypothetical protein
VYLNKKSGNEPKAVKKYLHIALTSVATTYTSNLVFHSTHSSTTFVTSALSSNSKFYSNPYYVEFIYRRILRRSLNFIGTDILEQIKFNVLPLTWSLNFKRLLDTPPQTGKSRVRFPMVSLAFFVDNPFGRTMTLGSTQPLTEISTRNISWEATVRRADTRTSFMCRLSKNLGASTSWNPKGLSTPVMGLLRLLLDTPI